MPNPYRASNGQFASKGGGGGGSRKSAVGRKRALSGNVTYASGNSAVRFKSTVGNLPVGKARQNALQSKGINKSIGKSSNSGKRLLSARGVTYKSPLGLGGVNRNSAGSVTGSTYKARRNDIPKRGLAKGQKPGVRASRSVVRGEVGIANRAIAGSKSPARRKAAGSTTKVGLGERTW